MTVSDVLCERRPCAAGTRPHPFCWREKPHKDDVRPLENLRINEPRAAWRLCARLKNE